MGSIVTYYDPEYWYVEKEENNKVIVIIGEIDDYHSEEIRKCMSKDLYDKIRKGVYKIKKNKNRNLDVYNRNYKKIICEL